jgi:hypothetical protein
MVTSQSSTSAGRGRTADRKLINIVREARTRATSLPKRTPGRPKSNDKKGKKKISVELSSEEKIIQLETESELIDTGEEEYTETTTLVQKEVSKEHAKGRDIDPTDRDTDLTGKDIREKQTAQH